MGSNFSHTVLEQHSEEIQQAIQPDLAQLVEKLVKVKLVDEATQNRTLGDPAIAADVAKNAKRILTVIKGKIKDNPSHFDTFTGVLRESNLEQQIQLAGRLEEARKQLKKEVVVKRLAIGLAILFAVIAIIWFMIIVPGCGKLDGPANGFVSLNGTAEGDTATYSCKPGYVLEGENIRVCDRSGNWAGSVPECRRIKCGPLDNLKNGFVSLNSTEVGATATYSCKPGFVLEPEGENVRVCNQSGNWTRSVPVCRGINCGPPGVSAGGVVSSNGTGVGSVATYDCKPGFVLEQEGGNKRVCNRSGNWTGSIPECKRVNCSTPKQLRDGTVSYDGTGYNMVVVYKCDEGYSLIGSSKRVCQSNGRWSGEEPICESVKCSELEHPMHGEVKLKERTFRSKAHYMCNDGFYLFGDEYRICQANSSWSGSAPFCGLPPDQPDEIAFSIYQKIDRIQNITKQMENQSFIAHALEIINVNVAHGRLQAGIVGLLKSGKSTALNALMKTRILPEAVQPETAAEVRIIHSTKEQHRNGLLLDGNDNEIASGSDAIYEKLREYNKLARNGDALPHDSLILRIPLPFLKENELNFSLEISDTAGPDEAGATDAMLRSLSTMERLSVFIIALNYRRMKSKQEADLLTHLRENHPQLLETHDRFLFIVNAIDAYYIDGNENSTHPKDVPEYVQRYLEDTLHVTIPTHRIVPFSAKWALQSHLWFNYPNSVSNADYSIAVGLSAKIQNEEPAGNMRIPLLRNKKIVATVLKDFSGIRELESKLHQMLGINGPVILYKSAIDDTIAHISTLKKHIKGEQVICNITATTTPLHLHEQLLKDLSNTVTTNLQRMHELFKKLDGNSDDLILNRAIDIQETLASSLHFDSDSPLTDQEDQILKLSSEILEQAWSCIMSNVTGELKRNVESSFSALKMDIKKIAEKYNMELVLGELNYEEPQTPNFSRKFELSVPSDVEPLTVSALQEKGIAVWAVQLRRTTQFEVNILSFQVFKKAKNSCDTSVKKIQNEVDQKIELLRQELEEKKKRMENLNQMEYQLETVHQQLLDILKRREFQIAEEEEDLEEEEEEEKGLEDWDEDWDEEWDDFLERRKKMKELEEVE